MYDYQALVIGAGPGGYPCAIRLGQLGLKTLCVEKEAWGGVCLNVGCIPSKALINASLRLHEIRDAGAMGLRIEGPVTVDMPALQAWKDGVVGKLTKGVQQLLKGNNVERALATARLVDAHTVELTSAEGVRTVTAEHIVVATGSSPVQIPGFAFADAPILDSTGALALQEVPDALVVIGGGVIGLELGTVYARLGAKVTVVEMLDQILPGVDPDAVKLLARKLKKDGVEVLLQTRALGWEAADKGIIVKVAGKDGVERPLAADYALVTVGRRPNTEGFGLRELGVAFDGPFVKVDGQLRTNVPSVFAIGDVIGNPMLAHKATHDGEVAAEVIAGHDVVWDARAIPAVVFTDPEIAQVGLTEAQAKEEGRAIRVGKVPFAAIGKAIANNATDGFVKVLIDAETKVVLGCTIYGSHASDLISEASLAVEMGAEAMDVGLTIHAHPTLGEAFMEACKAALGEAIHVINR